MKCGRCDKKINYFYIDKDFTLNCNNCASKVEYERCFDCFHFFKVYKTCPLCNMTKYTTINELISLVLQELDNLESEKIENDIDKLFIFDKYSKLKLKYNHLIDNKYNSNIILDDCQLIL